MSHARTTTTTAAHGSGGGSDFDDLQHLHDVRTAALTRLVVTYDDHLRSITAYYGDAGGGVMHGGGSGTRVELALPEGEYVTTVEGTFSDGAISKIQVETNKGTKWGPFGRVAHATTFVWTGFGPGMGLLYFNGKADSHIRVLRATFAAYYVTPVRPAGIKYEKHIDMGAETPPATAQSIFAANLMSPTITLLIGPDSTVFHASQDLLCRLPFFRAALQGEFREAATRQITMPEDDASSMAALIEFLYTGSYTYAYHATSEAESDTDVPGADLAEGAFHIGVHATAAKYGSAALVEAALGAFVYVLGRLQGVEVLRLWRAAYRRELLIATVVEMQEAAGFKAGAKALVRELCVAHPVEMERVAVEVPGLVLDLLRLVVCAD